VYIVDTFRHGKTVTFSHSGTVVYRDRALILRSTLTPLSKEFGGRLLNSQLNDFLRWLVRPGGYSCRRFASVPRRSRSGRTSI
jgi:hypothetical protein